ncbi:DUF427 domain-containing protein [Pseudaminobacter sp. 19-2017]|uniref:DUF427 domain-containing protein n=1 Tax=Pseudaminobacter soli (ex Zhang et al. 2022) TaxID=2831468 RepID=A0A942E495_9HYPH|nr:DUF427 domain-containing protein [Pseudaminobacter soli]MBS3648222.1 DUF427 domain-containing protein [Pseudaminobacter soli]
MTDPAPGHKPTKVITVEPYEGEVVVSTGDVEIARSTRAKVLSETPYPPVFYIPFADIDFSRLSATEHSTHCPYKGDASYWSADHAGEVGQNAMWAYLQPFEQVAAIKDHGAFYPGRVTISAA